MKKLFYSLFAITMAVFSLTSCEDVPEPYTIPGGSNDPSAPAEGEYINESFSSSFGKFTEKTVKGTAWVIDYNCAQATGYDNSTKVTTPSDSYLISEAIDLSKSEGAYITFSYILRYFTNYGEAKPGVKDEVLITNNYTGDPSTTQWTDITGKLVEGTDWDNWYTYSADIPSSFIGKDKVVIALHYTCESNSATWEVKNLVVKDGKAEATGGDEPGGDEPGGDIPVEPVEGESILSNGSFESWEGGYPVNWKTQSTAGNATLEQSSDAHTGSSAVLIKGASKNTRLSYKEVNLKAGDYSVEFYAKGVGASSSVRPGYATFNADGTINSSGYKYGDYTNNIPSEWTLITYSFTLDAEAQICPLIMNPKDCGDVLIDDYKLVTKNGGLTDGTGGGSDEPSTGDALEFDFASGKGNFVIENVDLGTLTYVWKEDTSYGYMKASAYVSGNKAAESWLVSPSLDLSGLTSPVMTINNAVNYLSGNNMSDYLNVMVSKDYNGSVSDAKWTALSLNNPPSGSSWTFAESTVDLKDYAGSKIHIAFKYKSTTSCAPTWEVKSLSIK